MNKFSHCCLVLHFIVKMDRKHLLATAAALIVIRRRRRHRLRCERREWVQKWLLDRGCYGAVANLMKTQLNDAAFQGFLRMSPEAFHQLLDMITPLIQKQDTMMREAVSDLPNGSINVM